MDVRIRVPAPASIRKGKEGVLEAVRNYTRDSHRVTLPIFGVEKVWNHAIVLVHTVNDENNRIFGVLLRVTTADVIAFALT